MAARFWVGGGASANWNATANTNWGAISGGANNQTVPGAADDVTFDGAGVNGNTSSVVSASITILSLTFTSGYTQTVTINTTFALTIAGNFTDNTAHSWTVNGTGSMVISATSTITSGGKIFPGSVTFSNTNTRTLSGDWTITGTLTISSTCSTNSGNLYMGGLTLGGITSNGSTIFNLTGGTLSSGGTLQNSLNFAGNSTVSGFVSYNSGIMTYVSGIITTTGSTITISAASTLNTNGITWSAFNFNFNGTVTINSTLTANSITITANPLTFAGTAGWNTNAFTWNTAGANTMTLAAGVTYAINSSFSCFLSRAGSIATFASSSGSVQAILTLAQGATCNVLANFTRIDASNGRVIFSFLSTITSCTNVVAYNDARFTSGKVLVLQGNSN